VAKAKASSHLSTLLDLCDTATAIRIQHHIVKSMANCEGKPEKIAE
jgi:hypothetical protein